MAVYNIDVRYKTSVERTERVLEIAESFGLGLDAKEFVVFDNTPIEIEQGDIVYITGQSGGVNRPCYGSWRNKWNKAA